MSVKHTIEYYFNRITRGVNLNNYAETFGHPNQFYYCSNNNYIMLHARNSLSRDNYLELCRRLNVEIPLACPKEGAFVGYKKGISITADEIISVVTPVDCLIVLDIPAEAKRSSAFGTKCRCSKAFVKEIIDTKYFKEAEMCRSMYDPSFIYRVGQWIEPDLFDEDRFNECSNGIHFFMTEQEALMYV